MCLCYYKIVNRATKLRYVQRKVLDIEEATKHHSLRTEVKLSSMCFIMVFFYTTVWSPYAFVSLWSVYDDVPVWATTLPTMFAKLASTLNPYIYVIGNPDFRKSVSSVMRTVRNDNTVHPRREE
ncbi:hypothetical protein V1264_014948 [Littorina saxatilis]|uniref:G-protein coupled receptors family 1 profile domain-containing protein n=2 Tax=Littorina saxatilis TaxID=31220 RepID=A0AAN9BIT2_9CAEN